MVREKGPECINARDLGDYMGCSSRPLFTAFRNMDELIDAVRMEASARFLDCVRAARDAKSACPAAKRMGTCIVRYAQTEPNLYKFIHWTGRKMFDVEELSRIMATQYQTDYQLSDEDAKSFFDHMISIWVSVRSSPTVCANLRRGRWSGYCWSNSPPHSLTINRANAT